MPAPGGISAGLPGNATGGPILAYPSSVTDPASAAFSSGGGADASLAQAGASGFDGPLSRGSRQLGCSVQSNSSVKWFKGQYQNPNTYIQVRMFGKAALPARQRGWE